MPTKYALFPPPTPPRWSKCPFSHPWTPGIISTLSPCFAFYLPLYILHVENRVIIWNRTQNCATPPHRHSNVFPSHLENDDRALQKLNAGYLWFLFPLHTPLQSHGIPSCSLSAPNTWHPSAFALTHLCSEKFALDIHKVYSLTSILSLLKLHLLWESFPDYLYNNTFCFYLFSHALVFSIAYFTTGHYLLYLFSVFPMGIVVDGGICLCVMCFIKLAQTFSSVPDHGGYLYYL